MKNISFDNPYWLLLAIPLLLALLIPFFISINKDNRSKGWITSLILHILIVICVTLAAAGLLHTTVMTRTKVYVVADVSHSMKQNFDVVDGYIREIEQALPQNSKLGIVCFGKDNVILTSSGTAVKSVREAVVDDSGTDIASALDFTSTIFSEGELKRIILITDGCDTTSEGSIVSAVERLAAKEIKLDTIYVDSNLKEGDTEVQISDVEYTASTYLDHQTEVKLLVEANNASDVILDLYSKGEEETEYQKIDTTVLSAEEGLNLVSFPLPTNVSGTFDYKAVLTASQDTSSHNNAYTFTQTVAGKRKILLITEQRSDVNAMTELYSSAAEIDSYVIGGMMKNIPYTVEDLSAYDEIILSNVDIRKINNIGAFVDSVDIVVSRFGKSLITVGDLLMQNKDDEIFTRLEELLPVSFGNANKDEKLYTIILDVSRSMNDTSQLIIAKDAAIKLLSLLDDADSVVYVPFAGTVLVEAGWKPMKLGDIVDFEGVAEGTTYREWLYREIQEAEPYQGTLIGAALDQAYQNIKGLSFGESQVMLISDGLSYSHENEDAVDIAKKMRNEGITVSTISVISNQNQLPAIAEAGGGTHYSIQRAEEVADLVFATIADELTESVIEKKTPVNIVTYRDDVLEGILSLPDVYGYLNSKAKPDATTVLSVDYQKNADTIKPVPLYAYRDHGNGRIATFTSSLSKDWLKDWNAAQKAEFFGNLLITNTPKSRIDYPFDVNVSYGGEVSTVEILPSYLNPRAKAQLKLTFPSGKVLEKQLAFDLNRYFTTIQTPDIGKYQIEITYAYGNHSFVAHSDFNVPYYPEYNAFTVFDAASVYDFMRTAGKVYTDGKVDLSIDPNEVATYEYSMRIPLLIAAVSLFVIDIFIRKTRWKDIQNFFRRSRVKGGRKQ